MRLRSCCFSLVLAFVAAPIFLVAEEPAFAPTLCIETGMHTGSIQYVSVDAAGRLALTCSTDKTARLWQLPKNLKEARSPGFRVPLRTFRVPLSPGDNGKLYACALSPDGSLAAVGGLTYYRTGLPEDFHIFIFDTATGAMVRRMSGFRMGASHLAFSADGQYLAATFFSRGLCVWEARTGREVGRDEDSGGAGGLDWHGSDKLVTLSLNGVLRLYSFTASGLKPTTKAEVTREGAGSIEARFSPDGRHIAVGVSESDQVAVHDAASLKFEFAVGDVVDRGRGGGGSGVAWSKDGLHLAAGGLSKGNSVIRVWPEAGRGKPRDFFILSDAITGIQSLPGGGFVYGTFEPSWGVLLPFQFDSRHPPESTESHHFSYSLPVAMGTAPDFVGLPEGLRVSPDGTAVAFAYHMHGEGQALFSLGDRQLTAQPLKGSPLSNAETVRALQQKAGVVPVHTTGLPITGWKNSEAMLAGKPLPMGGNVTSRCLAVARDASAFFIGTDTALHRFEADGTQTWDERLPDGALWLNLADQDRILVAGLRDGTIHWYRADNLVELLVLFPDGDRKRWVVWTPYYVEVPRPMLGVVTTAEESTEIRDAIGPAKEAGLTAGDVVTTLGGKAVSNFREILAAVATHKIGDRVPVAVMRKGQSRVFEVTLAPNPKPAIRRAGEFYDCSPGAEELIGWHVNRGVDQAADFFPAAKFRDQFYRPDVIQLVLKTLNPLTALRQADAASGRTAKSTLAAEDIITKMAPPVVALRVGGATGNLEFDGDSVTVSYIVRSSASPATRMRVLLDGRPLSIEAPLPADENTPARVIIPAPERDAVLSILAENRFATSEPVNLRLTRKSAASHASSPANGPAPDAVPAALKPKLYLLAIGISKYAKNDRFRNLDYAAKDARDFASAFLRQDGGLYQKVETRVLTDERATAGDVLDGLDWIRKETTSKDVAVVFISGHGENDEELRYYFCPHDYDHARRLRTGVSMNDIQGTLAAVPGKILFFIDTCHSGNALGKLFAAKGGGTDVDITRLVNELSSAENGAIVFASSTGRQISVESEEWQNSAFTKAVVEGLDGKADLFNNGKITVSSMEAWIAERVKELSEGTQTPTVAKPQTVPDFPIGLRR